MKRVILLGSSGMVGGLVLTECLQRTEISHVTTIVRRSSSLKHPKLIEVVHHDYLDYSKIAEHLKNQDLCLYCLGVYSGTVSKTEFRKITVDYTRAFAEALRQNNDKTTVCFLSGQGADSKEKSRIMFARDKGTAENLLLKLNFDQTYLFRPGYIYPVVPRKEPNVSYRFMRFLYMPVLSKLGASLSVSSQNLAQVMVDIGINGGKKLLYENKDIRNYFS